MCTGLALIPRFYLTVRTAIVNFCISCQTYHWGLLLRKGDPQYRFIYTVFQLKGLPKGGLSRPADEVEAGPGRVAQSVGHLTRKSGVLGSIPVWQHTFVSPSAFSRRAVVSYWRKYVHEVLVNRLGGLSLPSKSVVRLTDRPDMTLDVYRGRKTTMQQQQQVEAGKDTTWSSSDCII